MQSPETVKGPNGSDENVVESAVAAKEAEEAAAAKAAEQEQGSWLDSARMGFDKVTGWMEESLTAALAGDEVEKGPGEEGG